MTGALRQLHCPTCGRVPTTLLEARQQRADISLAWLEPNNAGDLIVTHHCVGCAPHGPITDIACVVCGEGSLFLGVIAAQAHEWPDCIRGWLHTHGWQVEREPTCPAHLDSPAL